jgi:tetratricopeptide (TPR) repeat protein
MQDAERQRWEEVIGDLVGEAAEATDRATKLDCLREAALMYERQLADGRRALVTWQAAFAEDPGNEEAALALERLAEALGVWATLLPECENLVDQIEDKAARAGLLLWLARWQERIARDAPAAEERLREAAELAPTSLPVAEALSAFLAARGDWADAAATLELAGGAMTDTEEAVGPLLEAARLYRNRLGNTERAAALYRRVLERAPQNAAAAEGLAEVAGDAADPVALAAQYRRAHEMDPDNLTVIRQWADVAFAHGRWDEVKYLFDKLYTRLGGAVVAGKPDGRARLNEALDRFVAAKQWPEAVDVLKALASDGQGVVRAKYYLAAGKIAQHEMKDDDTAVAMFEQALEAQPEDLKTFERVYTILSAKRAWPQAEAVSNRMVDRLRAAGKGEDPKLMVPVWRRLGDVYRLGLRDLASAAEAYRQCARLAPEDRYAKLVAELTARA